jgi:DUF4097 and DUF4098 domain-containing protein YvlB
MMRRQHALALLGILALSAAWNSIAAQSATTTVMGSIEIGAGEHSGDLKTVNGSIRIGSGAVVETAHTVNGSITLDARASAHELKTVNGSIELADGARVQGSLRSVNGRLRLAQGADVSGDLENVNGRIQVTGAHVGGSIDTVTGGIELAGARIDGGIHVQKDEGRHSDSTPPRVVVGAGSMVAGTLNFERPVKLYVSEQARIGPVVGATAIRFSGDTPPAD